MSSAARSQSTQKSLARGVEEGEPGVVRRPHRVPVELGVQGPSQRVGGQDVEPVVAHDRGGAGHRLEHRVHAGPHHRRRGAAAGPGRARRGGPGEVEQVQALGLVERERVGEGLQDALGHAGEVPALEARVVVDAHAGEHRDLLPAQAGHAPVRAPGGQPGLLRGDPGPAGREEVPGLVAVVHGVDATADRPGQGGPAGTPVGRRWRPAAGASWTGRRWRRAGSGDADGDLVPARGAVGQDVADRAVLRRAGRVRRAHPQRVRPRLGLPGVGPLPPGVDRDLGGELRPAATRPR